MNKTTKEFIKEKFFKTSSFDGWQAIAENLLENGTCVVAGDGFLWIGGIGNFIKRTNAEGFFGCTRLTFKKDEFLNSEYYLKVVEYQVEHLKGELNRIKQEISDIVFDKN